MGLSCHDCNEAKKKFRGCNDKPIQPLLVDGVPLERCPAKIIMPEVKMYIKYYNYYKKGIAIFNGGISMYPAKLLDVFDILESAEIEIQERSLNQGK